MKYLKKAGMGLLFVAAIVTFTCLAFQWRTTRQDAALFPPPGELYAVNGQNLHLVCAGEPTSEQPTVILEAGRGSDSVNWQSTMALVAEFAHVCAYDRPGLGWSEPSRKRLMPEELTVNLQGLLDSAEILPPYMMVGHSIGGILARDFTAAYPELVSGIVLVDSSTENQSTLHPEENYSDNEVLGLKIVSPFANAAAHLGALRIYRGLRAHQKDQVLTVQEQTLLARRNQSHYAKTIINEMILGQVITSREELAKPLNDLPLYVLEKTFWLEEGASEAEIAHEKEWTVLQKELASLSTNSQWAEAEMSGHNIPGDDPQFVADAIADVLARQHMGAAVR